MGCCPTWRQRHSYIWHPLLNSYLKPVFDRSKLDSKCRGETRPGPLGTLAAASTQHHITKCGVVSNLRPRVSSDYTQTEAKKKDG